MRGFFSRIAPLALVGSIAFSILPNVSARAQDVSGALSLSTNATVAQLADATTVLVNALATATPTRQAEILATLAANGNALLISSLLTSLPQASQTALAAAVVSGGNSTLIATVVLVSSRDGKAGAVSAMSGALANSSNAAVVQNAIAQISTNDKSVGQLVGDSVANSSTNPDIKQAAKQGETGAPAPQVSGPVVQPSVIPLPSPAQNPPASPA